LTDKGEHPKFSYRKWGDSIAKGAAGGLVTGGVGSLIAGGADAGTLTLAAGLGGAVWGAISYPWEYFDEKRGR
jgi:hypothetical protein